MAGRGTDIKLGEGLVNLRTLCHRARTPRERRINNQLVDVQVVKVIQWVALLVTKDDLIVTGSESFERCP